MEQFKKKVTSCKITIASYAPVTTTYKLNKVFTFFMSVLNYTLAQALKTLASTHPIKKQQNKKHHMPPKKKS